MQPYLTVGFGFCSSVLTDDDFESMLSKMQDSWREEPFYFGFHLVKNTENDFYDKGYCTIVFKCDDYHVKTKTLSLHEMIAINSQLGMTQKQRDHIESILKELNLDHYIDEVDLVVYTTEV